MKRKISTLLMTSAVILSALLIPTVLAEKPIPVSGTWSWWASDLSPRVAGGVTFISATEHDTFLGTFDGSGVGPFVVRVDPNGFMTGIGRTVFTGTVFTGIVGDKEGTLVIQWTGNTKTLGKWYCQWVILSGTDELANLRGSGIGVETAPGSYELELSGKIHFDPS